METTIQENAVGWRDGIGWERSLVLASGHGLRIPFPSDINVFKPYL